MELVRGTDQRAGSDGSPEQEALRAELREEGLEEPEIAFWCSHSLTVRAVLGYMVSKGVEVKVLMWASSELFSHYDPKGAHEQLTQVGVNCILDDSARGIVHHPIESLHQKMVVVDGTHAFVGDIDMLIALSGDFDRWDTHSHHHSSPLRSNDRSALRTTGTMLTPSSKDPHWGTWNAISASAGTMSCSDTSGTTGCSFQNTLSRLQ
jgi:hypothetical protein